MSEDKEKITVIHSTPLSDLIGLIKELGFPAVVTLGMGYFCYAMMSDQNSANKYFSEQQLEHIRKQDAILERICQRLDSMEKRLNP